MNEKNKWTDDDLKAFAAGICVQFFENYSESEAADTSPLVLEAWVIGREITEAQMETHRFED